MDSQAGKRPGESPVQRVTIDDVARSLGISKGTVSRALNGYTDIAETTRQRVRKAADALGYRPLSQAQAIRTGLARSVGLVLQFNQHDGHRPFLAEFLAGVSKAAAQADWTVTVTTAPSDIDTLRLLRKLGQDRKVDGFILPRTLIDDPRVHFLRDANIPFILYGRTGDDRGCAWFDIESDVAMQDAVMRLFALGHTRIGFIPGGRGFNYSKLRLDGYRRGLDQAGIGLDPALIGLPALNRVEGEAAALGLLARDLPPTAILCAVDQAAIGVYDAARTLGLQIGRELSVISYDGIPEGALMQPPLSTFAVDTGHAGARLADMLIRRIKREPPEDLRELARARFLDRGSHGAPACDAAALADRIRQKNLMMGGLT